MNWYNITKYSKFEWLDRGSEVYLENNGFSSFMLSQAFIEMIDLNLIENFAFKSTALSYTPMDYVQIESICSSFRYNVNFKSPSQSFYSSTTKGMKIRENHKYSNADYNKWTPSEQLYLSESKGKIGISGIFNYNFGITSNDVWGFVQSPISKKKI